MVVGDAAAEQQQVRDALDRGVGEPALVSWLYSAPAIVLGRGQKAAAELLERADRERVAVVGRASGGGVVMAGPWMLSITLLLPISHAIARASLPAGYRVVGDACQRALSRLRVPTAVAETSPAVAGSTRWSDALDWACFARVSHGELLARGGRKIVGISQVRRRDVVAVCIGVLLGRPDWESLVRLWLGRDDAGVVQELESRTAGCDEFAPSRAPAYAESLAAALESELPALRLAA